jgi:hypothetical protein
MQTAEGEIKISNLDWEQRYRIIFSEHDAFGGFITSEHDGKVRQDKVSSRTEHRFSTDPREWRSGHELHLLPHHICN